MLHKQKARNKVRAKRAVSALRHYKKALLKEGGSTDFEDMIDLLTDLRHWSLNEPPGYNFEDAVESSLHNFETEVAEASPRPKPRNNGKFITRTSRPLLHEAL